MACRGRGPARGWGQADPPEFAGSSTCRSRRDPGGQPPHWAGFEARRRRGREGESHWAGETLATRVAARTAGRGGYPWRGRGSFAQRETRLGEIIEALPDQSVEGHHHCRHHHHTGGEQGKSRRGGGLADLRTQAIG